MRPEIGETTDAYATRLREKAHDCDFGSNCDDRILEHLIQTAYIQVLDIARIFDGGGTDRRHFTADGRYENGTRG